MPTVGRNNGPVATTPTTSTTPSTPAQPATQPNANVAIVSGLKDARLRH